MDKNDILNEVNHKNTIAFEQALKDITIRMNDLQIQVNSMTSAISGVNERITSLENQLNIYRASSFGTGPSIKG